MRPERTSAGGVANTGRNRRVLRVIILLLLIIDFGSFAIFVYNTKFNPTGAMIFAEKKAEGYNFYWKPFIRELKELEARDYVFLDKIIKIYGNLRAKTGVFADYFTQKIIRFYVIFYYVLMTGSFLFIFAITEGLVKRKLKILEFKNLSSTRYHITLRAGIGSMLMFIFVYICLPVGVNFLGFEFPSDIGGVWLGDPLLWSGIIVFFNSLSLYYLVSNLPMDI